MEHLPPLKLTLLSYIQTHSGSARQRGLLQWSHICIVWWSTVDAYHVFNPALHLTFSHTVSLHAQISSRSRYSAMTTDLQSFTSAHWSVSERQQQPQATLACCLTWLLLCRLSLRWHAHGPPTVCSHSIWCILHTKMNSAVLGWVSRKLKVIFTVFMLFFIQWPHMLSDKTDKKVQHEHHKCSPC